MTTPAPPPQQVPPGQQPVPPPPSDAVQDAALVTAIAGLLLTAVSAAALLEALKLRFRLSAALWSGLEGSAGIAMQSPPPVTGVVGAASAQTSRQNLARRAQFVLSAGRRLAGDVRQARAQGKPAGAALLDGLARERRYYGMHVAAMWQRATSAGKVDMAALEHGRLLGWSAIRRDGKTSAECKAADYHNFYADRMPDIGWPGSGPHPNCRCEAVAPWPGAPLLPGKYAMAMTGTRHVDLAFNPAESRNRLGKWTGGPAFHGTTAELKPGDLIHPGRGANFDWSSPDHAYFTDEAHYGEAVRQAQRGSRRRGGKPHVYQVEPTGDVERDPDYAISGGSFRSRQPLRVVGEDNYWQTDPRFARAS